MTDPEAQAVDVHKDFKTFWHCEPPDWYQSHVVTDERWVDQFGRLTDCERHIYAWEPR